MGSFWTGPNELDWTKGINFGLDCMDQAVCILGLSNTTVFAIYRDIL